MTAINNKTPNISDENTSKADFPQGILKTEVYEEPLNEIYLTEPSIIPKCEVTSDINDGQQETDDVKLKSTPSYVTDDEIKIEIKDEPIDYDQMSIYESSSSNYILPHSVINLKKEGEFFSSTSQSKLDFDEHLCTRKVKKSFQCQFCSSTFDFKVRLEEHTRRHGKKPFQCHICSSKFAHKSGLRVHLRLHTGEKPYKCQLCSSTFTQWSSLNYHLRVHNDDKPFHCQICSYKFVFKSQLKYHLRTHSDERPFQCKLCSSSFRRKDHLEGHIRSIHTKFGP